MALWTAIEYYTKWSKTTRNASTSTKPHIITTNVEHDAILLPLKKLELEQLAG